MVHGSGKADLNKDVGDEVGDRVVLPVDHLVGGLSFTPKLTECVNL